MSPEKDNLNVDALGEVVDEEAPVAEKMENKEEQKESPFIKGHERMEAMGNWFNKVKERIGSVANSAGNKISNFWNKTKSFGKETVAGVLSADVLANKGLDYVVDKADQAEEWVGDKVTAGAEYVGAKAEQARDWSIDKAESAGEWVESKADQVHAWVDNKGEQISNFAKDKVELVKDVAFYAKTKTAEGLHKAKEGIGSRWNKIKEFGGNAWMAGKMEANRLKENFNAKMNEIRLQRLQKEHARIVQEESATSERAQQLAQYKAQVAEKLALLQEVPLYV